MWGKFEKFALRPLFSSVVAGARAHEQLHRENNLRSLVVYLNPFSWQFVSLPDGVTQMDWQCSEILVWFLQYRAQLQFRNS